MARLAKLLILKD